MLTIRNLPRLSVPVTWYKWPETVKEAPGCLCLFSGTVTKDDLNLHFISADFPDKDKRPHTRSSRLNWLVLSVVSLKEGPAPSSVLTAPLTSLLISVSTAADHTPHTDYYVSNTTTDSVLSWFLTAALCWILLFTIVSHFYEWNFPTDKERRSFIWWILMNRWFSSVRDLRLKQKSETFKISLYCPLQSKPVFSRGLTQIF